MASQSNQASVLAFVLAEERSCPGVNPAGGVSSEGRREQERGEERGGEVVN